MKPGTRGGLQFTETITWPKTRKGARIEGRKADRCTFVFGVAALGARKERPLLNLMQKEQFKLYRVRPLDLTPEKERN